MLDYYNFERKTLQEKIAENEEALFNNIDKYIKKHGNAPSIRELTRITRFRSTSTTHAYINRLVKKGLIEYKPMTHRSIKVVATKKRA